MLFVFYGFGTSMHWESEKYSYICHFLDGQFFFNLEQNSGLQWLFPWRIKTLHGCNPQQVWKFPETFAGPGKS